MDVEGDAPIRLMTSDIQQTLQTIYKQNKHLTLYQRPESRPWEVPTFHVGTLGGYHLTSDACFECVNYIPYKKTRYEIKALELDKA